MTGLDEEGLEMLKSYLGRDVSQEVGSCRDYMDVYNLHIEDLRELVRKRADVYAAMYVMHLLGKGGFGMQNYLYVMLLKRMKILMIG